MKQIHLVILLIASTVSIQISAQQKKDLCCLLKKDLIGTWQRNDSIVGSGLNQNFQFFENNPQVIGSVQKSKNYRVVVLRLQRSISFKEAVHPAIKL